MSLQHRSPDPSRLLPYSQICKRYCSMACSQRVLARGGGRGFCSIQRLLESICTLWIMALKSQIVPGPLSPQSPLTAFTFQLGTLVHPLWSVMVTVSSFPFPLSHWQGLEKQITFPFCSDPRRGQALWHRCNFPWARSSLLLAGSRQFTNAPLGPSLRYCDFL